MGRDRVCLPFQFLLTSAQGHLKKANFSRKASMQGQELHFLKKLEVLVSSTIPSHPHYAENKSNKLVIEFEKQVEDIRKRIAELETGSTGQDDKKPRIVPKLQSSSLIKFGNGVFPRQREVTKQREETSEPESGSEASSLRSKLTESVKLLSPAYSPRRLEKGLKAAAKGSCLEQEASLQGKEWLKLDLEEFSEDSGTDGGMMNSEEAWNDKLERSPRKTNETSKTTNTSEQQRRSEGLNINPSRAAMKSLYKQLLGAGSSGKLVQEFRQTLNTLEHLVDKDTDNAPVQQGLAAFYKHDKASKGGDVDFVRGFITSTRALLNGTTKQQDRAEKQSETPKVSQKLDKSLESALKKDKDSKGGRQNFKKVRLKPNRDGGKEKSSEGYKVKTDQVKLDEPLDVYNFVEEKINELLSERLAALVTGTEQALGCIRTELETAREVGDQLKTQTENAKKLNDHKFEEIHCAVSKLQKEGVDIRLQAYNLKRLEESLRFDRDNIKKLFEFIEKDSAARKSEIQTIRKEQEELYSRVLLEGETEKAVMMDKIERLSQLYIGGLEEVRTEVINLKTAPNSTARAESLLAEMRNRRKKSMHLESVMKNAVEAALKLQEKYSLELEKAKDNWNWAMNLQIGEAKTVLGELTEQSHSMSAQLNSVEGHNVLLSRIQNIEGEVGQLLATVKPPLNEAAVHGSIAKHKEVIQKDLKRLDGQLQDALKKLESAQWNLDQESLREDLEEKLKEVTKSRAVILEKITEMGKKVRKLEGAQMNLVRSVEELQTSTSDLEMSASNWLPKYESAASLLKDMDSRLGTTESLLKGIEQGHADVKTNETAGKEVRSLKSKFDKLEDRVELVASETLSELRTLDSKLEQCKTGVQSALEGAAVAENKCGVLGAEIVKVFRMFAARNGKLTDLPEPKQESTKDKAHSSCKSCKKVSSEKAPAASSKTTRGTSVLSHEHCHKQGQQRRSSTFFDSYVENLYETRRGIPTKRKDEHSSDNETQEHMPASPSKRRAKDKPNSYQHTSVRLEAGKVICT